MESKLERRFDECLVKVFGQREIIENISEIDSVTYVELIVILQQEFKVKFQVSDIASLRTIAKIKQVLEQSLEKNN